MLLELAIQNFVLIEEATLELAPGFTVLTGETGAGKTLLTQALGLLLGERAVEGLVGPAADEAVIQAVLQLPRQHWVEAEGLAALLGGQDTGELIVTRRLAASGRNRCFLNGLAVNVATLGRALTGLVAFTGQQEHRRLLEPGYQRLVLDAFAGEASRDLLRDYREQWLLAGDLSRRLREAGEKWEERRRERELLAFQVAELEQAALSVAEEEELRREQAVLARAEELRLACGRAAALLSGEGETPDAATLAGAARATLSGLQGLEPTLDGIFRSLTEAAHMLTDAARELRRFAEKVNMDPERREEVERRLRTYVDLGRKYGQEGPQQLVALLEGLRSRLQELTGMEEGVSGLEQAALTARQEAVRTAAALSQARRQAAPLFESAVARELAGLGMEAAQVTVALETSLEWEALGETGGDAAEFRLLSNPGLPPRPLARVASGGELSRTLLAVKCALAGLESTETLVFDEIDAGIGGQTALAVGEKLRRLSRDTQVVVITHLPQVAAFADRHYVIEKVSDADAARTRLVRMDEEAVLVELCRMMGGRPEEQGAMAHAAALRRRGLQA